MNGLSPSSRWHHVAIAIRPPGLRTRAISCTYFSLSGMCSPLSHAHTRSNESSANFMFSASTSSNLAFGIPRSDASAVARAICSSLIVIPVTCASGNFFAR